MADPKTKDVTLSSGLKMRCYRWDGSGPNLVLLHPSSGYGRMWDKTADALGGQFQVFAPDQRGHGDTDRPDGGYAAEDYAQDLHQFIHELGLSKVIVAGHSLGGRVAQVFAAKNPEQCEAVVLVGGPHFSNFFPKRDLVEGVLQNAERMRASKTEFPNDEKAMEYLRTFRPGDSEENLRHRIEHNTRALLDGGIAFKYDNVRVAQGLTHIADDLRGYARKVTCPVAIIRGAYSTHLAAEDAIKVARFWRHGRIVEVEGDYALELENPQGLANAILGFARVAVPA